MWRAVPLLAVLAGPLAAQDDGGWALLGLAEITETPVPGDTGVTYRIDKRFDPALQAAAAAEFTISGYLVPLLAEPYLDRFLLVPDPADCPFCGNAGYGPSLPVDMKRALPDLPEGTFLILSGQLELDRSAESFDLYRLFDAVRVMPDG